MFDTFFENSYWIIWTTQKCKYHFENAYIFTNINISELKFRSREAVVCLGYMEKSRFREKVTFLF